AADKEPVADRGAAEIDAGGVDLGLGDDVLARISRARGGYRERDRATGLVVGNVGLAEAAIRLALRRGAARTVAACIALGLHVTAARGGGSLAYLMRRCDQGAGWSCREAALLVEATHRGSASGLHRAACSLGYPASCAVLRDRGPIPRYEEACTF